MNNFFHSELTSLLIEQFVFISFLSVIWLNLSHMRNATELRESPITDGISLSYVEWFPSVWWKPVNVR